MQKSIRQKKRQAGKQTARQEKKCSEAQLAKYNRGVAKERLKRLKDFKFLLKERPPFGIEPAVRNVSIKFTKLPFGYIMDSCQGHFNSLATAAKKPELLRILKEKKLIPNGADPKLFLSCRPADFDLVLDYSRPAMEFRAALKELGKENCAVKLIGTGSITTVNANIPSIFPKKDEHKVRQTNTRFIRAFEALVDRFVAKYGINVRL